MSFPYARPPHPERLPGNSIRKTQVVIARSTRIGAKRRPSTGSATKQSKRSAHGAPGLLRLRLAMTKQRVTPSDRMSCCVSSKRGSGLRIQLPSRSRI
ncbi:hypothetical protein DNX69_02795 [Rhodopseudomonas palustris]|uniref:Uncharacterized protein n=1 Tax=Rhodopseudomonas palustris TaxID=1076 RepID=A0A323UQA8_RHOPL|nr:hypothetical protein DNX69_02795 [Rhodopseudomonas palustris]